MIEPLDESGGGRVAGIAMFVAALARGVTTFLEQSAIRPHRATCGFLPHLTPAESGLASGQNFGKIFFAVMRGSGCRLGERST